jgi:glutamate-1-semialdehyde 2,1-aminomutase
MRYRDIMERAQAVAERPVRTVNDVILQQAIKEHRRRTPKSRALCRRAGELLPRGSEHTLPSPYPYSLFMSHGRGSQVWDVDGNQYADYVLSGGAILLGHSHEVLNRKMMELIGERTGFHGFYDELELLAAEKIRHHVPSAEKVRFTASGAEANLAALRIARSYTGRSRVVKYQAGYHGWADAFMTDMEIPGSGRFLSQGVPDQVLDLTVVVPPDDLDALEAALLERRDDAGVAAVFCEPFGGESGLVPFEEGFHRRAMELAHAHGALYVFDEVVTGWRVGLGGAQALLGVQPDLTTLGKALMNGYPGCGAVCGNAEIMDTAATGLPDGRPFAYIAGTLSGGTLSAAAAYYTILELEKPGIMDGLLATADDYVSRLNRLFTERGTDYFAYNFGGVVRIELTAPHAVKLDSPGALDDILRRRNVLSQYSLLVQNQGVLTRMGRDMISCSHTREDNDRALAAYGALLDVLVTND